jgi:hypothetical protein
MDCLKCTNFEQALELRLKKYRDARSAPFYRVSTELAAKTKVDLERARYEMEEHQSTCLSGCRHVRVRYPDFPVQPALLASEVECIYE